MFNCTNWLISTVESIDMGQVLGGEMGALPETAYVNATGSWCDCGISIPTEGVCIVVHQGTEIISNVISCCFR